jgi:protein-ribulosamine 3-kinase
MTVMPSADAFGHLLSRPDGLHRVVLDGSPLVVKVRRAAPGGFFQAEADGLQSLAAAASIRVPALRAVARHGIVIEDLGDGVPGPDAWQRAGRGLARLHRRRAPRFGFPTAGWCGDSPQDNREDHDGFRFFAERRLLPQGVRARDSGLLAADDLRRLEALSGRLHEWLPPAPAVLVHGDLWSGNLHGCGDGELALIDAAAVHHGWAETDLAMLTLFGAPPPAFFAAYQQEAGCDDGWRQRAPLLNLYPLLNHLNLFGSGYLDAVRAVLRRFG